MNEPNPLTPADLVETAERTAGLITRGGADFEDVRQAVRLRLTEQLDRINAAADPHGYAYRAARNAPLQYVTEPETGPSVLSPTMEAAYTEHWQQRHDVEAERHERTEAVQEAIADLPADQQRVCALRYVEGLSVADTAERLGITEPAVKGLTRRALETLRSCPALQAIWKSRGSE
jgi:RNA polymerase sigma-70 factor (ECF subfamily)